MEERELPLIYDSEEKKAEKAYIKARTVKKPEQGTCGFYLNRVGYKDNRKTAVLFWNAVFYLNHVGYKGQNGKAETKRIF